MNKFNEGKIEYLKDERYVERYLMEVEGKDQIYICTRWDIYEPVHRRPIKLPHGTEPDCFQLGDIWYTSYRQVLLEVSMVGERTLTEQEITQKIMSYHDLLLIKGKNLNLESH